MISKHTLVLKVITRFHRCIMIVIIGFFMNPQSLLQLNELFLVFFAHFSDIFFIVVNFYSIE